MFILFPSYSFICCCFFLLNSSIDYLYLFYRPPSYINSFGFILNLDLKFICNSIGFIDLLYMHVSVFVLSRVDDVLFDIINFATLKYSRRERE